MDVGGWWGLILVLIKRRKEMTDRETRHKIKRKKKIKFYFNNYERTRYEEIRWKIKIGNGIKINLDKKIYFGMRDIGGKLN